MKIINIEKKIRRLMYEIETRGMIYVDDYIRKHRLTYEEYLEIKSRVNYRISRKGRIKLAVN